jgi:hypothetical protein
MLKYLLNKRCLIGASYLLLLGGCATSAQWTDYLRGAAALLAADVVRTLAASAAG